MASFGVAASTPGWDPTVRSMKALPSSLKREVGRRSRDLAEPLAREIRSAGAAQGSHAAAVARRVKSTSSGGLPMVKAAGLPYVMGSEFGGGTRRTTYPSHSPLGRRYLVVQRHTTRQFQPFKGKTGYWFTPQLRASSRGAEAVMKAWRAIIDDVLSEF
jgi:hypothetical protein